MSSMAKRRPGLSRAAYETTGIRCPLRGHQTGIRFDGETPEGAKKFFCTTCRAGCVWHEYDGHQVIQTP